jgi:hypothetical protein
MPAAAQRAASQVPGEEAFSSHHQTAPVGRHGLQKWFRSGCHLAVAHDVPGVAHHTDLQTTGVQVDATGQGVLVGVEAPEVSSSFVGRLFPKASIPLGVCCGGDLNHYQGPAGDGCQRPLVPRSRFQPRLMPGVKWQ